MLAELGARDKLASLRSMQRLSKTPAMISPKVRSKIHLGNKDRVWNNEVLFFRRRTFIGFGFRWVAILRTSSIIA